MEMKRSSPSSFSGYTRQENPKKGINVLETCTVKVEESRKGMEVGRERERRILNLKDSQNALLYIMNNEVSDQVTHVTSHKNKGSLLVSFPFPITHFPLYRG